MTTAQLAKLEIERSGLTAKQMANWADQNILQLLNQAENPVTTRVTKVVDLCRKAIELTTPSTFRSEERHDVLMELNRLLVRYKWHPRTLMGRQPHLIVKYEFTATNDGAKFENRAVQWLMDHIDVVHRIRRCHRCNAWLFAVTDHQKYCGESCRKQDAATSDAFKKKRKDYMKRYRATEAERNARAKRLAKGK